MLSKLLPFDPQETPFLAADSASLWGGARAPGVVPVCFPAGGIRGIHLRRTPPRRFDILHGGPGEFPVGLTLALLDIQAAPGGESKAAEFRRNLADNYLEQFRGDDFVGVQTYYHAWSRA